MLAPIASMAEERDLAAWSTGHLSKAAMSALLGTGGSIGFVGAPRSILIFGLDPRQGADRHRDRMLAHAKCNVGRQQPSLAVQIVPHIVDSFGKRIETSRAQLGDSCDVSADDLVQVASGKDAPKIKAMKFLRDLLADGPHKVSEVSGIAADAGIAERTLKRAKKDLGCQVAF